MQRTDNEVNAKYATAVITGGFTVGYVYVFWWSMNDIISLSTLNKPEFRRELTIP